MGASRRGPVAGGIVVRAVGAAIALTAWSGAATAETARFVPFAEFLADLASTDDHVARSAVPAKRAAAVERMRQHLLKMYSGVAVARSFQRENELFDCLPINDQPGVRLRKIGTIATPPPSPPFTMLGQPRPPNSGNPQGPRGGAEASVSAHRCEGDSIPMRRLTLAELARFDSLEDFFAKGSGDADGGRQTGRSVSPANDGHSYAHAYQIVNNYGGYSQLALYRPTVDTSRGQIFSLSQQWYAGGSGAQLQTVEVGWQNYPQKYGTQDPVLFIFWTADNYQNHKCYNLDCAAFVQTNSNWLIGGKFANYSTVGGAQYHVALGFYLYEGNWWLAAENDWVGYYPGSLFLGGPLTRHAERIDYGGETTGATSWPPMGSGEFASAGWLRAAYHRKIQYRDSANSGFDPSLTPDLTAPGCYTSTTPAGGGADWGIYFFFGGSGGGNC